VDDTDADSIAAALREAEEEVDDAGFHSGARTLPIYTTGSAFIITPVVALVRPGFTLAPTKARWPTCSRCRWTFS